MTVNMRYNQTDFAKLSASQRAQTLKELWSAVLNWGHGPNGGPFTMREFMNVAGKNVPAADRFAFERQGWSQIQDQWTAYMLLCMVAQGFRGH